ncbi:hypothetical protein [Paraglaciecola sp. 20A4]|uniref:hypothetical protein n=1 Tax=Paraglaciecola sp. 20A4 TaxID=2687288 RepID=UPI00140C90D4|nr:hypothetical protein [Paraglaciecola sp. 20A4]
MEQQNKHTQGGNIDKSLAGETTLDLSTCAKEGWAISKQHFYSILQGGLFTLGMILLLLMLIGRFVSIDDLQNPSVSLSFGLNLLFTLITTPLITALMMMGISHSIGLKTSFIGLVKRLAASAMLIFCALMLGALVNLGIALYILPGIYLAMSTGFALVLLVEKKYRPSQAILMSMRVFNRYWLPLSQFYILSFVLFIAGLFTFGIALIWLVPWYIHTKGVLYRTLFGVEVIGQPSTNTDKKDSVFYA